MPRIEYYTPEEEHRTHTYRTHHIPWYVHLWWVSFWILAIGYVLYYQVPAIQSEFLTRYELTDSALTALDTAGVPEAVVAKLQPLKGKIFETRALFIRELGKVLTGEELESFQNRIVTQAAFLAAP